VSEHGTAAAVAEQAPSDWDAPERIAPENADDVLVLELDGFEGPLDLLLVLARNQKVDLTKISILRLAEQYLDYIEVARELRLEIAADYLVMAAWLAYLKSKLLLPEKEQIEDGPTGQELAAQLAFRLKRLDAMREVIARIMNRKRLGVDLFGRGLPEGIRVVRSSVYQASIFDLLKAYAEQRQRTATVSEVKWGGRVVWSIKQARDRLSSLLGHEPDWAILDKFLEEYKPSPLLGKTVTASSFGATLELAREGYLEIRQHQAFGPLYLRWLNKTPEAAGPEAEEDVASE